MAEALATAYNSNILNTLAVQCNGNLEAPAEIIPEFIAIFNMTTSTADA